MKDLAKHQVRNRICVDDADNISVVDANGGPRVLMRPGCPLMTLEEYPDEIRASVEDRAAEARDEDPQSIRAELHAIYDESRRAQEAERAELAKHEMIDLQRELAGFIQSGRAARRFVPFQLDTLAAYLAAHPQFWPRTLADAVPEPMSNEEAMARHAARHGLPVPTPAQRVLVH